MKHIHFDIESDGFYGAYWACKGGSDCAVIAMLGDDPEDYMARSAVKWLLRLGVNVLTMSPGKKDYGHHNYPLERIEKAIAWLKSHGNEKIGIAGASTTGTLALTAASLFGDISLTIAMTPSDFVWQGFMQGKKDGCKEWPIEGESLFSYKGKLREMMRNPIMDRSVEYNDNRLSLYCGQMGRCYVTKQPLELGHMHCHHRIPRHFGGDDKYGNLVLVTDEVHRLLHATQPDTIAHYMLKLKPDSKQLRTLNRLRRWLQLPEFQSYTSY